VCVDPEAEEDNVELVDESAGDGAAASWMSVFEDEETRTFYQDFPDLKVYLPPVAYRDNLKQTAEKVN